MKKTTALILTVLLILCMSAGCGNTGDNITDDTASDISETSADSDTASDDIVEAPAKTDFSETDAEMFTDRDLKTDYDENGVVQILLNKNTVTASSDSVKINGTTVTITEDATYIISGTLDDGMIIVDAPDTAKMQLVFNGVNIHSETSAALYILEADKVFITLAKNTENTLSNGGTFVAVDENNIDAALFSKQDLTVNGYGSLEVTSPSGHGIVCKDDLVITGGTYNIASASNGLDANDSIRIINASITADAGKDGFHAENDDDKSLGFIYISGGEMHIEAEGDGISAGSYMHIEGGIFDITAGGGSENAEKSSSDNWGGFMGGNRFGQSSPQSSSSASDDSTSMKGLKSAGSMLISDGNFTINSADDSIHSNESVKISGGSFEISAGDDAIHADDTLTVVAGNINISESYEGLEAFSLDIQGGDIKLCADDDGLNAAGGTDSSGITGGRDGRFGGTMGAMSSSSGAKIVISGGNLYIKAYGDGIDANGTLSITGGNITVVGPTQGDTSTLDYDVSGTITGGTFIGTGASQMAQSFSSSQQGVVAVGVGNQAAGTLVTLKDKDGNTIISYTPELSFAVVILSSPEIQSGETYTITVGSTSGDITAS